MAYPVDCVLEDWQHGAKMSNRERRVEHSALFAVLFVCGSMSETAQPDLVYVDR